MLGLDASGKTTVLYKMKLNEYVASVPTIGFNVETVEYKNLKMTIWDVGGQTTLRSLWRHYYDNADALIYLVDSTDKERIETCKESLYGVINDSDMMGVPVLVLANKQDAAQMTVSEIMSKLELDTLKGREWKIQGCCAVTGDGLFEGLDWLNATLKKTKK